jgi:hypothetical protein
MSNTKTVMSQASNQYVVPLDIDELFSTYLYTGTGSAQTITNGIDLDGEGGLVWAKIRDTASTNHMLVDTERGVSKAARTNFSSAEQTGTFLDSFNSNGFTLANNFDMNGSGYDIASWTFRKAPKFFTCLTYTGTGPGSAANEQQVSHDLGAKPGIVIIKRTDATGDWWVFTDVIDGSNDYGYLNQTAAFGNSGNNVATDSVFNVGGVLNTSGATYTAYLFANNNGDGGFGPDGDQDVIKCGVFTDSASGGVVDLGWEPQWVLVKNAEYSGHWFLLDNMRGYTVSGVNDNHLLASTSGAESTYDFGAITSTGFTYKNDAVGENIYIAIRRGPLAQPESATEVFAPVAYTGTGSARTTATGFVTDLSIIKSRATYSPSFEDRLRGANKVLESSSTGAEVSTSQYITGFDLNNGVELGTDVGVNKSGTGFINWSWKRAPGYFDVVAYEGNSTAGRTVSHNLGVAPEMMWIKSRNNARGWRVYHSSFTNGSVSLNSAASKDTSTNYFSTPTADNIILGSDNDTNRTAYTYIAYLFASLPGISKVGSYTGNGTSQTIDCGFTSGARFILIKRTDATGDWNVYDTERGIVAGNDSRLSLNTTDAEDTSNDRVDPSSSGFAVNYIATGTSDSNISGASYIFYAIA